MIPGEEEKQIAVGVKICYLKNPIYAVTKIIGILVNIYILDKTQWTLCVNLYIVLMKHWDDSDKSFCDVSHADIIRKPLWIP